MRLELGLGFQPDAEQASPALDLLTGIWRFALVPKNLMAGLCLRATDVEKSWGEGAEIGGPIAALMMAARADSSALQGQTRCWINSRQTDHRRCAGGLR